MTGMVQDNGMMGMHMKNMKRRMMEHTDMTEEINEMMENCPMMGDKE